MLLLRNQTYLHTYKFLIASLYNIKMADQKLILGYWGVTGLGQALRYILAYSEADWKDEVYADRDKWFLTDKAGLGIPLANLPYLIDGDFKLS